MLGLRKEKQNSGDNFNKKFMSLDRQYRATSNKKKRQALVQQGLALMYNQMAASQKESNPKAKSFIKQCKADHENELGHVWKVSRMGNNHFNIEFINPHSKSTHNFIILFKSTKPYGGLEYSITETSSK